MAKVFELAFQIGAKLQNTFKTAFTDANGQLTTLSQNIAKLNSTQNAINKFNALNIKTQLLQAQFQKASAETRKLQQEINNVGVPAKKLQQEFERAKAKSDALATRLTAQQNTLRSLKTELNQAGVSTSKLGDYEAKLAAQVEKAKRSYDSLNKAMAAQQAAKDKRANIKGQVLDTAALAATAATPVVAFAQLENESSQLQAALMDSTGKVNARYQQLYNLSVQLGNKLPGDTANFLQMNRALIEQGLSAEKILGGVGEATAYLAVQARTGFTETAEWMAKMQDSTQATDSEMVKVADMMQRVKYLGVDLSNQVSFFSNAAPAIRMMRIEGMQAIKQLAPLNAIFDQKAINASSAGNAMRKIVQKSFIDPKIAEKLKQEYGLKLDLVTKNGEFKGIENMLVELQKLTKYSMRGRVDIIETVFGNDAEVSKTLNALIDTGLTGYKQWNERLEKQASLQQRVEVQLGTLTNIWDALKGTAVNALAAIGAPMAQTIKPILDQMNAYIGDTLQPFVEKHQKLIGILGSVFAGLVAMKVAALAIGYAWSFISGTIATLRIFMATIKSITFLQGIWNAVMAANPVFLIVAGIAALTAGLIWFFTKTETGQKIWATFSDFVLKQIENIKSAFGAMIEWVVSKYDAIAGVFGKVKAFFGGGTTINAPAANTTALPAMGAKTANNTFTYNPTIQISGNADKAAVQQAVKAGGADFDKQMQKYWADQKRLSFGY